jgi:hypothetical protein
MSRVVFHTDNSEAIVDCFSDKECNCNSDDNSSRSKNVMLERELLLFLLLVGWD